MNEVIQSSGDIRRILAQTMLEIRSGDISVEKGLAIAQLSKEITSSLQIEVNVAKVRVAMLAAGQNMGKLTKLGRLIIDDEEGTLVLDGRTKPCPES
jgi:hypothetical protein